MQREQFRIGLWSASIEKLRIHVPWKKLGWEPILISLDGVLFNVATCGRCSMDGNCDKHYNEMLRSNMVDAVICVQSDSEDRLKPMPILARTPEEVYAARAMKPTLSPNLNTLVLVEAIGVKRLLFCGVGYQVHGATTNMTQAGSHLWFWSVTQLKEELIINLDS